MRNRETIRDKKSHPRETLILSTCGDSRTITKKSQNFNHKKQLKIIINFIGGLGGSGGGRKVFFTGDNACTHGHHNLNWPRGPFSEKKYNSVHISLLYADYDLKVHLS